MHLKYNWKISIDTFEYNEDCHLICVKENWGLHRIMDNIEFFWKNSDKIIGILIHLGYKC